MFKSNFKGELTIVISELKDKKDKSLIKKNYQQSKKIIKKI